ncbi:MAG TPA: carbon-nitrogen hydrolase family protein [Halothiobacillaceae bacterium]|nr:carbon-nitrogen hydrolase family protein [Halothiobacillaceae bacterium]
MNKPTCIATVNINTPAWFSPEYARRLQNLVAQAAVGGARVVVLPENVYAMPENPSQLNQLGFGMDSAPVDWFARLAKAHGIWLVAGTLPIISERGDKRLFARSIVFDDAGRIVSWYDKIHLFDVTVPETGLVYQESAQFIAGNKPVVVDTPAGVMGLTVCFDLRFPELYRRLTDLGATIFAVPSAFTQATGQAHWASLIAARAIENLAYVVAAAQVGTHADNRATFGHSRIVDPWGRVLADAGQRPDCVETALIDPDEQNRLRSVFPVLSARRL